MPAPAFAQSVLPAGDVLKNCLAGPQSAFQSGANADDKDVSFADPSGLIYDAAGCAQETAIAVFVPTAQRLLAAFAIIILVWTGIQMMLQGGLDMGSLLSTVGALAAVFAGYLLGFFAAGVLIFILTPPVMLYCQYLWGLVTMLVAILLGPIFVPFLLIPQLSFLFWGWIKSLFGGMIHSIVAAGLFVLVANLMLLPIQSFVSYLATAPQELNLFKDIGTGLASMFLYVPIVILAYLVAFRVSEITGMVLGGGVPSAELADAVGGFRPRGAKTAGGVSGG